ncbi:long-chain-fatty-acid--CoA ligase [Nocardia sp. BMG51109]|uniref:long-chain-fatty-acid--CoA ligase n=1 Tax=Nocardia sp. BMG51109 TaxID=1056816 RepID=UPI000467A374|nr:long-chain-fatty-acid--CoA ligase [Nocardia sp. BMG51109]
MISPKAAESVEIPVDFAGLCRQHAESRPDDIALVCGDRSIGYAALQQSSARAANALLAAGLGAGDRIAYIGRDSEHLYELLIAAAETATVLIPVNRLLTADELAHILLDSGCRLLFVDAATESVVVQAQERAGTRIDVVHTDIPGRPGGGFTDWLDGHPTTDPNIAVGPDDPLIQMYTSGTTGLAKGVMIGQRSIYAARESLLAPEVDWFDVRDDDRLLVAIPSFHIAGLAWVVQGLFAGVPVVLLPEFTPGAAVDLVVAQRITVMVAVPVMFALMLGEPAATGEAFTRLRLAAYGGSPIPETLLAECMKRFDCGFVQFYGMTETGCSITYLPPADHTPGNPRLRSAGYPCPGFDITVVDTAGDPLPPGEIGEILVRSPATMLGYWNKPEVTAHTLVDGWLHTGDAGWLDPDGYLFLCDRIKDMIIVGGENVYPAEVENAITAHPAVREAAVIGVPDERWGEVVHAFVAVHAGAEVTGRELAAFLRDRIAPFKLPRKFDFVDYIPRNTTGKILHRELRDRFWAGRERAIN